jgi:AcrR family transcriptional regulator
VINDSARRDDILPAVARLPQPLAKAPVGRTRLSREALSEHQRERILVAATEVFAKRGYQASTVDNIVAAAEIGVGSFYAHFEGKEDCLMQVCDKIALEVHMRITTAVGEGGSWAERGCNGLHALLRYVAANPMAARVALLEVQTGGPEPVRRYSETIDEIATFLHQGRAAAGLDPQPPPSFEEAVASGLFWLLQERLVRGEINDVESLFAEMAEVALEPYLGARETKREIKAALTRAAT